MIHYITNFIVYTLAMVGVLVLGFIVYKKTVLQAPLRKNPMLKVMDMLRLTDRKVLYVIECKNEQFLIASSNDNISLISKIDTKREEIEKYLQEKNEVQPKENIVENKIIKSLLKELSDKNQTKRGKY